MSTPAVIPSYCLDANNNQISCNDANVISCFDQNGNSISCFGLLSPVQQVDNTGNIGQAMASTNEGGMTIASSGSALTPGLITAIGNDITSIYKTVNGPAQTKLTLGTSSLSLPTGGLFSNPLALLFLAVLAFFAFGAFKKQAA